MTTKTTTKTLFMDMLTGDTDSIDRHIENVDAEDSYQRYDVSPEDLRAICSIVYDIIKDYHGRGTKEYIPHSLFDTLTDMAYAVEESYNPNYLTEEFQAALSTLAYANWTGSEPTFDEFVDALTTLMECVLDDNVHRPVPKLVSSGYVEIKGEAGQ